MPTLVLGVIDLPYTADASPAKTRAQFRRERRNAARAAFGGQEYHGTTGDVAEILEEKYHIFEHFWQMHKADISEAVLDSLGGSLENLMMGAPAQSNSLAEAMSVIETKFKQFLSNREMDSLGYPGIPTAAAQAGVSHRFAHPYAKRGSRPSFVDTGLLQANLKAWTD